MRKFFEKILLECAIELLDIGKDEQFINSCATPNVELLMQSTFRLSSDQKIRIELKNN